MSAARSFGPDWIADWRVPPRPGASASRPQRRAMAHWTAPERRVNSTRYRPYRRHRHRSTGAEPPRPGTRGTGSTWPLECTAAAICCAVDANVVLIFRTACRVPIKSDKVALSVILNNPTKWLLSSSKTPKRRLRPAPRDHRTRARLSTRLRRQPPATDRRNDHTRRAQRNRTRSVALRRRVQDCSRGCRIGCVSVNAAPRRPELLSAALRTGMVRHPSTT